MKAIYKSIIAAVAVTPLLTSCLEETFPNNGISQEQLEQSTAATAALVWAMPGNMIQGGTVNYDNHFDFGYPAIMHARDVMTDDMVVEYGGGYDWFASWSSVSYALGEQYLVCQFTWNWYYSQILTCNKVIAAIDPATEDPMLRFYLASALAYRAMIYQEAAATYESLPVAIYDGKSPDGKDILGLTIPIVTEQTTEEESRKNPRATHEKMFQFIKGDLEKSLELFSANCASRPDKTLPSAAVVKGLLARTYMWDASFLAEGVPTAAPAPDVTPEVSTATAEQQYTKAAQYAREAIDESSATPLTREEWLSTSRGFNDQSFSSWMFALQYVKGSATVKTSIINWISFICNEQEFGYASVGAWVSIGAKFYESISDRDFRKLSYVAPEGSALQGQEPFLNQTFAEENLAAYNAIKFRPGSGVMTDYNVGAVVAIPLMRVEEMYLTEAEATAHINPAAGNDLLKNFMKSYRYGTYDNSAQGEEEVVSEIIFQKRVELWGEGRNFFDVKRLNISVDRKYDGTNFDPTLNTYNTEGRPAWMNFCIVNQENYNNVGVLGYNNPDPYQRYSK